MPWSVATTIPPGRARNHGAAARRFDKMSSRIREA
jgi:hypothetical protein